MSALDRLTGEHPLYLKVEVTHQKPKHDGSGRHYWTVGGTCDPLVDAKDIAALIEARFAVNSQVRLSGTAERMLSKMMDEVRAQQQRAEARTHEADEAIEQAHDLVAKLEVEKQALENDPRIQENQRRVDELQAKAEAMVTKLALGSLPDQFDANEFPEAGRLAEGVIRHWQETLDDPSHLVGGDFTELETILTRSMQKLAMLVADKYRGLVDV